MIPALIVTVWMTEDRPYSKQFRAEHEADILLYQAAKQAFGELRKLRAIKANTDQIMGRVGRNNAQEKEYGQR